MTALRIDLCPIGESIAADRGWPPAVAREFSEHAEMCIQCNDQKTAVYEALGASE